MESDHPFHKSSQGLGLPKSKHVPFHPLFISRDSFVRDFVLNGSSNFPQTIHVETLKKSRGGIMRKRRKRKKRK
jgi:hypothetical protein